MCTECYGLGCPMCSEEPETIECEFCDNGKIYVTAEDGEVDYATWLKAPKDERMIDECEHCNGTGIVELNPEIYNEYAL